MWNRPVSQFMKRHVYVPLIARGYNPLVAQLFVFTISAVLHELVVGVPTHNIIGKTQGTDDVELSNGNNRCRICWNDVPAAAHLPHRRCYQDQVARRADRGQCHLLDQLCPRGSASRSPVVFLCLASKVWKREQTKTADLTFTHECTSGEPMIWLIIMII